MEESDCDPGTGRGLENFLEVQEVHELVCGIFISRVGNFLRILNFNFLISCTPQLRAMHDDEQRANEKVHVRFDGMSLTVIKERKVRKVNIQT